MCPVTDITRNPDAGAVSSEPDVQVAPKPSLEDHAKISAEIAEGQETEAEVLKRYALTSEQWNDVTLEVMTAIADDVQKNGVEATLAIQYSDVFAAHQQSLKPASAMTPEQWAELQFDIEREGSPERPLLTRQMSLADYMRVMRVFAKRIAEEPEIAMRVERRTEELEAQSEE